MNEYYTTWEIRSALDHVSIKDIFIRFQEWFTRKHIETRKKCLPNFFEGRSNDIDYESEGAGEDEFFFPDIVQFMRKPSNLAVTAILEGDFSKLEEYYSKEPELFKREIISYVRKQINQQLADTTETILCLRNLAKQGLHQENLRYKIKGSHYLIEDGMASRFSPTPLQLVNLFNIVDESYFPEELQKFRLWSRNVVSEENMTNEEGKVYNALFLRSTELGPALEKLVRLYSSAEIIESCREKIESVAAMKLKQYKEETGNRSLFTPSQNE